MDTTFFNKLDQLENLAQLNACAITPVKRVRRELTNRQPVNVLGDEYDIKACSCNGFCGGNFRYEGCSCNGFCGSNSRKD